MGLEDTQIGEKLNISLGDAEQSGSPVSQISSHFVTHVEYGLFPSYDLFAFNLEVSVPGTVEIVAMMEAICWPSELQVQSREYLIGSGARKRSLPHRNKPLRAGTCEHK